jgi:hypothetical protein
MPDMVSGATAPIAAAAKPQSMPSGKETPMKATPAPVIDEPAARPAATSQRGGAGALIVCQPDPRAQAAVRDFCAKLGLQVAEIIGGGGADANPLTEQLDQHPDLAFGLILSRPEKGPQPFELGYCVGRLGHKRVFVLTPGDEKLTADEHGLLHIPLDPADGWQLHLARQLKRAGLEIDLNRVF